jgi:hypothetical protein
MWLRMGEADSQVEGAKDEKAEGVVNGCPCGEEVPQAG